MVQSDSQERIAIFTAQPYLSYHPNRVCCPLPVTQFLIWHISPC